MGNDIYKGRFKDLVTLVAIAGLTYTTNAYSSIPDNKFRYQPKEPIENILVVDDNLERLLFDLDSDNEENLVASSLIRSVRDSRSRGGRDYHRSRGRDYHRDSYRDYHRDSYNDRRSRGRGTSHYRNDRNRFEDRHRFDRDRDRNRFEDRGRDRNRFDRDRNRNDNRRHNSRR